jgi:glucose uptake protein GlcU
MSEFKSKPILITTEEKEKEKPTPLRCLLGAIMAGALSLGLYRLTYAIAVSFATKPITTTNQLTRNIASAVRTLVVGVASLGTFVFGFVALGLVLLGIQLTIQGFKQKTTSE